MSGRVTEEDQNNFNDQEYDEEEVMNQLITDSHPDYEQTVNDLNLPEVTFDSYTNTFTIPLIWTVTFKKISWTEVQKSVRVIINMSSKVIMRGLEQHFNTEDNDVKEMLEDVMRVNFRINDDIVDEEVLSRDIIDDLAVSLKGYQNESNKSSNKLQLSDKDKWIGKWQSMVCRLDDLMVDISSDQKHYPFDSVNIRFNFDFFTVKKLMVCKMVDNVKRFEVFDNEDQEMYSEKTVFVKFKYHLMKHQNDHEMLKFKPSTIDNLETHHVYKNYNGYLHRFDDKNKISYFIKIVRSPYDVTKTAILPLIVLMLLGLAVTSFGEYQDQLANLLAVYLAYGQFILVFNDETIDSKNFSIADKINFTGIFINVLQYCVIIYYAYFSSRDADNLCQVNYLQVQEGCLVLYTLNAIVWSLFVAATVYFSLWMVLYSTVILPAVERQESASKLGKSIFKRIYRMNEYTPNEYEFVTSKDWLREETTTEVFEEEEGRLEVIPALLGIVSGVIVMLGLMYYIYK